MKNKYGFALLLIAGILAFWSCKSTGTVAEVPPVTPQPQPEPQPPPPSPSGPGQAELDALDAAMARAERGRKLAEDFKSPSYFPAEWGDAETGYGSITADKTSTATIQDAERRYNAAADTYEALFRDTVPLYAADLRDAALKARDEAIAAGILDYVPEYLDAADEIALGAERAYLAEDYYKAEAEALKALDRYNVLKTGMESYLAREGEVLKARDEAIAAGILDYVPEYLDLADEIALEAERAYLAEDFSKGETDAQEALDRYRSLKTGMEAYLAREEIERRGFAAFDQANFDRADETLLAAAAAYEGEAAKDALARAGESKAAYESVLKTGWAAYTAQLRALAQRERRNALDAKANVAVREDFSRIDQIYNQAESAYNSKAYNNAAGFYIQAETGFAETVLAAEKKRQIAQTAIEAADKKLTESESTVENAEKILEGGEE
ncbi:MAG: hypothetical protein LBP20_06035 [Treponema sp.]|nr:hypothetical protein [Treponema sp.]